MEAKGHAGYAEKGKDIVCAGASALFYTAAEYLEGMEREGKLKQIEICMEPGDVTLSCEPKEMAEKEAEHLFRFLKGGCMELASTYPNNVSVTFVT